MGGNASNNTATTANYNECDQGHYNTSASETTATSTFTSNSPCSQSSANAYSSSVTQTIVSGISISLGIGNASNNCNRAARSMSNDSNCAPTKSKINQNGCLGNLATPYQNGNDNSSGNEEENIGNVNLSEAGSGSDPGPFLTQTLQQITGSPGRARDRNVFHTPTAAVQLPLLRGF